MQLLTINGKRFEVKKVSDDRLNSMFNIVQKYNGRTLHDVYNRTSYAKEDVFNQWNEWSKNTCVKFGVQSYNTFLFTLCGALMIQEHMYLLYITPTHNYLYTTVYNEQIDEIVSRETIEI